jgi:hypothetical protein
MDILNKKDNAGVFKLIFGVKEESKNTIIQRIVKQCRMQNIEGEIENTIYPFILEEKIQIELTDKEKSNIYTFLTTQKLKDDDFIIELKFLNDKKLNGLKAKYNNNDVLLKNYTDLIIEKQNEKVEIYLHIIISEFAKKEEGKIKDYCLKSVDKHVTKIINGSRGKKKTMAKTKSNNPTKA